MRFEFEWQEAPGVRDRVLASTWARLSLQVGDLCVSEAVDTCSNSRRVGIDGSLFPLAQWLVEHWWHLLHEPPPRTPVPGGREAPASMRDWVQRHNLLAARDGGALPDLTIVRDGDDVLVQCEPDPLSRLPTRIRFIGRGRWRLTPADVEQALGAFVEAVLTRLEERLADDDAVARTVEAWRAIRLANTAEAALCQALAVMGVDPYDPDEASDTLIEVVQRCMRVLPADLQTDIFEGSAPTSLADDLAWVERERVGLRGGTNGALFPIVGPVSAPTPHEIGYLTARRVRSELLGLAQDAPLVDLPSALVDRLGWSRDYSRRSSAGIHLEGMVGLDDASSTLVLVTADNRSVRAERFRLARAAYFPVSRRLGASARLLTRSVTPPQRAARAFAAELLAPAIALADRVSARVSDVEVEGLADEFQVSPQVILHQIENHGLGYVDM